MKHSSTQCSPRCRVFYFLQHRSFHSILTLQHTSSPSKHAFTQSVSPEGEEWLVLVCVCVWVGAGGGGGVVNRVNAQEIQLSRQQDVPRIPTSFWFNMPCNTPHHSTPKASQPTPYHRSATPPTPPRPIEGPLLDSPFIHSSPSPSFSSKEMEIF